MGISARASKMLSCLAQVFIHLILMHPIRV
jgi:hypothetical protein